MCATLFYVRFEWDAKKAAHNERKHRVSFEEATTVFEDPLADVIDDLVHPERLILVGLSANARLLFVVYVEKKHETIRIISAREATRYEQKAHEET